MDEVADGRISRVTGSYSGANEEFARQYLSVRLPGIFVQRVVVPTPEQVCDRRIEKRTVTGRPTAGREGPRTVGRRTLPPTGEARVGRIVTALAAIDATIEGPELVETAPGVGVAEVVARTAAPLRTAVHSAEK